MITLAYKKDDKIKTASDFKEILKVPQKDFIWLDVMELSDDEKDQLNNTFGIRLTLLKKRRIRHSFRFIENEYQVIINTRLLHYENQKLISKPISFTLEDEYLVSFHNIEHLSYEDVYTELNKTEISNVNGRMVFLKILSKILEYDIDIIEKITGEIVKLSKKITSKDVLDENLIYEITGLQEKLILIRRNIIDKQRVVLSVSKNENFSKKLAQKLITVIEKDINSILDYISFDFERLEYLQNTLMGLINLRQNVIMKIFTIVSVIFLPPTLIASIYGMNFQNMPELNFPYAYPIAISIMIILSLLALSFFKRKKWI